MHAVRYVSMLVHSSNVSFCRLHIAAVPAVRVLRKDVISIHTAHRLCGGHFLDQQGPAFPGAPHYWTGRQIKIQILWDVTWCDTFWKNYESLHVGIFCKFGKWFPELWIKYDQKMLKQSVTGRQRLVAGRSLLSTWPRRPPHFIRFPVKYFAMAYSGSAAPGAPLEFGYWKIRGLGAVLRRAGYCRMTFVWALGWVTTRSQISCSENFSTFISSVHDGCPLLEKQGFVLEWSLPVPTPGITVDFCKLNFLMISSVWEQLECRLLLEGWQQRMNCVCRCL